ncbi:hypothetical protein BKA93DRAFT_285154 [Sparassis latifolia]
MSEANPRPQAMPPGSQPIRVIVRIPYNRPEEPLPQPPLVDWNPEKEHILWEVIAKSRAIEGAATDWKGLASHLEVPLPYLLHRAQTRYEEDLRGLQGIRGTLSPAIPSVSSNAPNEYFPRLLELPRLSTSTAAHRPLGVRARLSSLGHNQRLSPVTAHRPAKKVSSSSTLTLQGPRKGRTPPRPLSPAPSDAGSSDADYGEDEDEDEEDEQARKEEEETRRAEAQTALEEKLRNLERSLTKDKLGLVSSPVAMSASMNSVNRDRGRTQPLSASVSGSVSFSNARPSSARSHQSLSSASSMHGSIPSIPSPPAHTPARQQSRAQQPSHIARTLSPQNKSTSPPALSPTHARVLRRGNGNGGERLSEQGSETSSFSDLNASLSASALESALMSNIRGGGSHFSSFARSNITGRRGGVR